MRLPGLPAILGTTANVRQSHLCCSLMGRGRFLVHKRLRARPLWLSARWAGCVIVLLVVALGGVACGPSVWPPLPSPLAPASSVSLHAPQRLPASMWEQVALPAASDMRGFAASPTDAALLFACSAQPMAYWRSTDAGAHWTRYPLTLGPQDQCSFSIAPDDPQRVTLQVQRSAQDGPFCAGDIFFLSDDGGVTWRKLAAACLDCAHKRRLRLVRTPCNTTPSLCAYSYEPSGQAPQVSLLERSDDDGASWVRADRGLGDNALFFMPAIGPGETLAMTVVHVQAQPGATGTGFWISTDAGDTWHQTSTSPDGVGTFLWTLPPRGNMWPTMNQPFYALENEQLPFISLSRACCDERRWAALDAAATAARRWRERLRAGILQALDVLPDGRLAVWGTNPKTGLPPESSSASTLMSSFWLWIWDPVARHGRRYLHR